MTWKARVALSKERKRTSPLDQSHWVDYDQPMIGRRQRALCGELVYDYQQSNQPTCQSCLAAQKRIDEMEF